MTNSVPLFDKSSVFPPKGHKSTKQQNKKCQTTHLILLMVRYANITGATLFQPLVKINKDPLNIQKIKTAQNML